MGAQCTGSCYDPTLGDTSHDESTLDKRDDGFVKQQNAAPEMVFVSVPEEVKDVPWKGYIYDRTAGTGQTVYICDTGAHLDNPVRARNCHFKISDQQISRSSGTGPI